MEITKMVSLMVEKGYLSEETMDKVLADEDFQKKRKERKKKTSEERRGHYDADKCQARVWKEGYDNIQCIDSKLDDGCLCKEHQTCSDKDEGWWLGMIKEPRPDKPVWRQSPGDKGVEHFWNTDGEGNDILKKEKKTEGEGGGKPEQKKKRGRPKGSKNKKKAAETKELTIEEIIVLLEKKKNEEDKDKDKDKDDKEANEEGEGVEGEEGEEGEGETKKYIVDGVPYEIKDDEIMDPGDFSPIGVTDGKGGITFEDEDSEEKHHENVEKYRV
jgi:hypothetical protein